MGFTAAAARAGRPCGRWEEEESWQDANGMRDLHFMETLCRSPRWLRLNDPSPAYRKAGINQAFLQAGWQGVN